MAISSGFEIITQPITQTYQGITCCYKLIWEERHVICRTSFESKPIRPRSLLSCTSCTQVGKKPPHVLIKISFKFFRKRRPKNTIYLLLI